MSRITLITGATDGLGRALAGRCAARGDRLVLLGRRALSELSDPLFTPQTYCQADLLDPRAPQIVLAFLLAQGLDRIDVLIHNAALGWYGAPAAQSAEEIEALLQVNVQSPLALTHALLPLLWRARGQIVCISSTAALIPAPRFAVYAASKAALDGFARTLRAELRGAVRVLVLHPGPIRTAMHAKSGVPRSWRQRRYPAADIVAAQTLQAIARGGRARTLGWANRALVRLGGIGPQITQIIRTGEHDGVGRPAPALAEPVEASGSRGEGASPHAVITGGGSGIGQALALRLALAGYAVTVLDRDAAAAQRTVAEIVARGGRGGVVTADLADPAQIAAALAKLPPHDLLVHSAGISAVGRFAGSDPAAQRAVLDVNLRAPLLLTAGVLARGLLRERGALVFLASLSVQTGYPGAAGYAASKDGLAHYAASLRAALRPQHIQVLTVYPGPTRTPHARRYSPDNRREGRRMDPDELARQIVVALRAGRPELIPGFGLRLFALLGRAFPAFTEALMRRAILDRLER